MWCEFEEENFISMICLTTKGLFVWIKGIIHLDEHVFNLALMDKNYIFAFFFSLQIVIWWIAHTGRGGEAIGIGSKVYKLLGFNTFHSSITTVSEEKLLIRLGIGRLSVRYEASEVPACSVSKHSASIWWFTFHSEQG